MPTTGLLPRVAGALAYNHSASLADLAAAAGVGRTTLHRAYATREALTRAVAEFAVAECDRIYTAAGVDDAPADAVLPKLADECVALGVAYTLLWADPPITDLVAMHEVGEAVDTRLEAFVVRSQAAGELRPDAPARWIVYSIGGQAMTAMFAVREGHIGEREAPRLFTSTLLAGLGPR